MSDVSIITVPALQTAGLSEAFETIRDSLATKPGVRDTKAREHLVRLIEIARAASL